MRSVFMRYPDGKAKAVTFSYDDGVIQDKRLAELFDKYGLKGTFNFNGAMTHPFSYSKDEVRTIFLEKGHEIAIHGLYHRPTGNIRSIEAIRDVLDCRLELEERCDMIIRGMAYPDTGVTRFGNFGSYESVKQLLTELDVAYARTLGGDNDSFTLPADFHAWMPTAHHNNPKIMEYIENFLTKDMSTKTYHAKRDPILMYIWGHSYEFDRANNWEHMEEICKALSGNPEIWYATNIEICDYCTAYKRLVYSADSHKVYNPSVKTVWLDVDGIVHCVKPDETINV